MTETFAEIKDRQELISLWKSCFTEEGEEAFAEDFLKHFENHMLIPVIKDEDRIISMTCLIPVKLHTETGDYNLYYLYAMCTHPDFRGKGTGLKLLDFAEKAARERDVDGIALLPAEEGLTRFYGKAGYENFFSCLNASPEKILYDSHYMDFVPRYEWGQPKAYGMLKKLNPAIKAKGYAYMEYPLN